MTETPRKRIIRFHRRKAGLVLCLLSVLIFFQPAAAQDGSSESAHATASAKATTGVASADAAAAGVDERFFIGIYTDFRVVDGDTFRIEGMDRGVRFLNIDTEEVPRGKDREEQLTFLREHWPAAYVEKRGESRFPVKMASPFGHETSQAAKEWFRDVDSIRLERDSDNNIYGFFDRWLAYVLAWKNGRWVNYNIECVRMGWSPYYGKYGYSERFHAEFTAAQLEARREQRGIWNPDVQHYPDYEERLAWWDERGEAVQTFVERFRDDDRYYFIGRDGEYERLALAAGRRAVVFGAVDWLLKSRPLPELRLPHKRGINVDIPLGFDVEEQWLFAREQQYVYVRGVVSGSGKDIRVTPEGPDDVSLTPLDWEDPRTLHFRGNRKE